MQGVKNALLFAVLSGWRWIAFELIHYNNKV